MSTFPPPKGPSSLVKVSRWGLLAVGITYGYNRREMLAKSEAARRLQEEAERPAREAAIKAEKDRRNQAEMEYLGRETGVIKAGGGVDKVGDGKKEFKSECGCTY